MEYNGNKRTLTVTIYKYVNGVLVTGYPKTYEGRNPFTAPNPTASYPHITLLQFETLSDFGYLTRYNAFKRYIESVESGFSFDTATPDETSQGTMYNERYDQLCLQ